MHRLLLLVLLLTGCDLFGSGEIFDGPPLEIADGATLGVDFGPTGNLQFAVPDSLYESTWATYGGTIRVKTDRLPNQTHTEQTVIWEVSCPEMTLVPRTVDLGVVPEGCQEVVRSTGVLPGRRVFAYVQSARVTNLGTTLRRAASATFTLNRAEAVVRVERTGDVPTFSWPQSVVDAYGGVYEVMVYPMFETEPGAAAYSTAPVWPMQCFPGTGPTPRLTSVTAGMEPPAPGCTIYRFDPPVCEPGRYVVFVSYRKDLGSPQVTVASVFEW